jgi:isoquinoline 1-oxidoreductase alpha subunit
MARLTINGKSLDLKVDPSTPLLWAIREQAGLTGTKYGCGVAMCGPAPCTWTARRSLLRDAGPAAEGKQVTTIEGLASGAPAQGAEGLGGPRGPPVRLLPAGMIMAVAALLKDKPKPTDADIDAGITNICRCGTFQQVREAIHAAAKA